MWQSCAHCEKSGEIGGSKTWGHCRLHGMRWTKTETMSDIVVRQNDGKATIGIMMQFNLTVAVGTNDIMRNVAYAACSPQELWHHPRSSPFESRQNIAWECFRICNCVQFNCLFLGGTMDLRLVWIDEGYVVISSRTIGWTVGPSKAIPKNYQTLWVGNPSWG